MNAQLVRSRCWRLESCSPALTGVLLTLFAIAASRSARGDVVIAPGETLTGNQLIDAAVMNQGRLQGLGTELSERLTVSAPWAVSGNGEFENTLILGDFSPGMSPGVVNGTNQAFGGSLTFELGGATPGNGANNHDQINDSATISLFGNPTINVVPFSGYVPTLGQTFTVMTWRTGLSGTFGPLVVNSFYTNMGRTFTLTVNNPGGTGSAVLTYAVPEAGAGLALSVAGIAAAVCNLSWRRLRTRSIFGRR